jgi:SHS2 domain-containing protein
LRPYKFLDHEADAGFEVYGQTEGDLYQNAISALFSLIVDLRKVHPEIEKRIEVPDNNESLIIFLNELLYFWDVERFIPKTIAIVRDTVNIKATIGGEKFDEHRHTIVGAVKAVTYHKFSIRKKQEMLKATFIVDM